MSEDNQLVFIVGDKFHEFRSGKKNIILVSEYFESLTEPDENFPSSTFFVPAQGLSEQEINVIQASLSRENRIFLKETGSFIKKRSPHTHKRKQENVIVSYPIRLSEDKYLSQMIIDDDCAEMADHCTGQHLQGMLLIEASRQMFIAVTEAHFSELLPSKKTYFVINDFDVQFGSFAFPLPVSVHYTVLEKKSKPGRALCFYASVEFRQAGQVVSEIKIRFSVHDQKLLSEKEQLKAQAALDAEISKLTRLSTREEFLAASEVQL